ncbi:UNVERIFIED_CONTAM: hypothetical protein RMT77_015445 [Armadillidium vulgare]
MGIDWIYLRSFKDAKEDLKESQIEDLYLQISSIKKLKQRDKTIEKTELLFELSRTVMVQLWNQIEELKEGQNEHHSFPETIDLRREEALLEEIENLTKIIEGRESAEDSSEIPYDWSKSWKRKKFELQSKLLEKEHEVDQLVASLNRSEEEKTKLEEDILELQSELSRSTSDLNTLASEFLNLEEKLKENERTLKDSERLRTSLEEEKEKYRNLLQRSEEKSKSSNERYNHRISKLNEVLAQKEKEILDLTEEKNRSLNFQEDKKLESRSEDFEEKEKLKNTIQQQKEEIFLLTKNLSEATKELDKNSDLFQKLERKDGIIKETEANKILKLRKELHESELRIKRLEKQVTAAEDDAQQHAQDLATVLSELKAFMSGEYSLGEAVADLKNVRRQVAVRDQQIQELTSELNAMQINMNIIKEENEEFRNQLSLDVKERLEIPVRDKGGWKNSKELIQKLNQKISDLEDEKVILRAKVFELTRKNSEFERLQADKKENTNYVQYFDGLKRQINALQAVVIDLTNKRSESRLEGQEILENNIKENYSELEDELDTLKKYSAK